jgi:E3 ubiquitin-protein ligase DOA10
MSQEDQVENSLVLGKMVTVDDSNEEKKEQSLSPPSPKDDQEDSVKEAKESSNENNNVFSDNTENCCWICFGTKDLLPTEVCFCKGRDSYVHTECLLKWISTSGKTKCCKCNYEYNIAKEYCHSTLAYINPFVTLVLSTLVLLFLLHYMVCSNTSIPVLSVNSLRIFFLEIDIYAIMLITIAFFYVYFQSQDDDDDHDLANEDGNTSLLQHLSKMFHENFHLTGLEMMFLYNIESSFSFISIRLLLILYETIGNYLENIIHLKFTKSTILPRSYTRL